MSDIHKKLGACSLQVRFAWKALEDMEMPANMELPDAINKLEQKHGKNLVKDVVHAIPNIIRLPDEELERLAKQEVNTFYASWSGSKAEDIKIVFDKENIFGNNVVKFKRYNNG
jgi:hypothetical protein